MKHYLVKLDVVFDGKEHTYDEVKKMETWGVMERRYYGCDNSDDAILTAITEMQNAGYVSLYIKRIIVNEIE